MKRQHLYEGPEKILYEGPEPGTLIQFFKDSIGASSQEKDEIIEGKGALTNRITEYIFTRLNQIGIPTYFIKRLNMYEQLIKTVDLIPLQVIVRNVASGSIVKRFDLEEGTALPQTIIEFYYKKDNGFDYPLVSNEHISAFGWAAPQGLDDMIQYAIRINDFLMGLFSGKNIQLLDFKLEFGRLWDGELMQIIVADEISPDTACLWDNKTKKRLDREFFYHDKKALISAYRELAERLDILIKVNPTSPQKPVLVK